MAQPHQDRRSYQTNLLSGSDGLQTTNDNQEVHNTQRLHSIAEHNHHEPQNSPHHYSQYGLAGEQVYTDCTVPLEESERKVDSYISLQLIKSSLEFINLRSLKPVEIEVEAYRMVDMNGNHLEADYDESHQEHQIDHDESGLAKKLFAARNTRGSTQAELIKSLNNIRLNMSHQHLIDGSRNIIGKVRGLSISDLNKPTATAPDQQQPAATARKQHHYKTQFYVLLTSLTLLFLYLIYQNLFSDK